MSTEVIFRKFILNLFLTRIFYLHSRNKILYVLLILLFPEICCGSSKLSERSNKVRLGSSQIEVTGIITFSYCCWSIGYSFLFVKFVTSRCARPLDVWIIVPAYRFCTYYLITFVRHIEVVLWRSRQSLVVILG